jgi:peptidoglycan/LPS O-acetylase OafA/YrhL
MTSTPVAVPTLAGRQLRTLTGLRWWAAFMVFATHAFAGSTVPENVLPGPLVSVAGVLGFVGVSCFFVLSGFVLTWSRRPDDTAPRFWRRRLVKIYPNHLVTMLVSILTAGAPSVAVLPNLLLVHAWTTDPSVTFGIDVSWSLSVEMFFYLSFPVMFTLVRRLPPNQLWYWAGGVVLAVLGMPSVAALLPTTPLLPWEPTSAIQFWFLYVFPPTRMLEFVLGVLLARIGMSGRWCTVPVWAAWVALGVGCVVAADLPSHYQVAAATVIPLSLLVPALALAELRGRRSHLNTRIMVWLGDISFAFYLVHSIAVGFVMDGQRYLLGNGFQRTPLSVTGVVAGGLALAVLLSWLLFELVEKPVRRGFSIRRR